MNTLFVIVFFLIAALIFVAVSVGLRYWEVERKKRVAGMLQVASGETTPAQVYKAVIREEYESPLTVLLAKWPATGRLDAWIKQAGLDWPVEQLFLTMLVLAGVGGIVGYWLRPLISPALSAMGVACLFAVLPLLYVRRKRTVRLAAFEKQFPEALDFLSRAMRAGHAFAATLEMLANESAPPLGPEFRKLYDEQNLGAPLDVALRKLAERVPLLDVRFFVSAVLLQRYTGGNLGEILRNLSRVIRERFQLRGHVRAASAHGRITAVILTILPIVTMLGLMLLAPEYLQALVNDSLGKWLVVTAVLLLGVGYYFMRRIVNIKI